MILQLTKAELTLVSKSVLANRNRLSFMLNRMGKDDPRKREMMEEADQLTDLLRKIDHKIKNYHLH